MKVEYNINKSEITNSRGGENQLILDFLKSDKENMRFTYETPERARQRRACIKIFVNRQKLPCTLRVSNNMLYVFRNQAV